VVSDSVLVDHPRIMRALCNSSLTREEVLTRYRRLVRALCAVALLSVSEAVEAVQRRDWDLIRLAMLTRRFSRTIGLGEQRGLSREEALLGS